MHDSYGAKVWLWSCLQMYLVLVLN